MTKVLLVDRFAYALAYYDAGKDYREYCAQQEYTIGKESHDNFLQCKTLFEVYYPLFTVSELRALFDLCHNENI